MQQIHAHSINADLHCHSIFSDGALAPEVLAEQAHANGVLLWSLTDHDEVGGLSQAQQAAQDLGMAFVQGVEISVTWVGKTLHIVGLNIDSNHPNLLAGLSGVRSGRWVRAQAMAKGLEDIGVPNALDGAMQYVRNPDLISRTHFARYLVSLGLAKDTAQVFQKYLSTGKPGYVPHQWASLQSAVNWIRESGGCAVLAHPARYQLNDRMWSALVGEFKHLGGIGVEVVTGSHTSAECQRYALESVKYQLRASRGSDFHGPNESRLNLGALPLLPELCTPIWAQWPQVTTKTTYGSIF